MRLSLPSAALGAALAAAPFLVVRVGVVGPVTVPGMPLAADLVTIDTVGISGQTTPLSVYTVPSGRMLVITGASIPQVVTNTVWLGESVQGVVDHKLDLSTLTGRLSNSDGVAAYSGGSPFPM